MQRSLETKTSSSALTYKDVPILGYSFLFLCLFFAFFIFANQVYAQSQNFASLNITDSYEDNFLSPYIRDYDQSFNESNISSIITAHHKGSNLKQNLNSLIYFGYKGEKRWLSFEASNQSSSTEWFIDFGDYFSGRFGLFKNIDIYVLDMTGNVIEKTTETTDVKNPIVKVSLPLGQKTMVAFKVEPYAGLPSTLPLKVITRDKKESIEKKRLITNIVISFGLVGMVFFFLAFAIAKGRSSYAYFSLFYIAIIGFLLLHSPVVSAIPLLGGVIIPLCLTAISVIGLFLSKIFWDEEIYSETAEKILNGLLIAAIAFPLIAAFLPNGLSIVKTVLFFSPSFLLLILAPALALIKSTDSRNEAMPFIFGWFILLFGFSISVFSVSGLMPPLSAMLNAFWYALIPQAIFFGYALSIKGGLNALNLPTSRTLEIEENETVSKVRQSKEQAEQDRLMKVIDQERKVLTELRKSEARRAEEMRLAKEEADTANKAKSAFLAVVTHEIRTPMTGIMGMVKMLLESGLDKKQKDYALTIQESSDAMLALLNDILDFEKIEQGKMQIESISFDLPRLIQGVVTLMNGHATQKNIELIAQVDSSLPQFVKGDPTRLRQVLLNLTGNAIKFTTEGSVTIKAQLIKKANDGNSYEVYLGVTDSGVGISKEGQQKIFEAFSQADDTVSRKFGGTGLGLAISKGLVEAMKSNININSNEGEGSTFFFTLNMPAVADQSEGANTQTASEQPLQNSNVKPIQILVVDDNKINRKVMIGFLESSPHVVETAESAKEALEQIKLKSYDLVFMDIEMPGMNGDEATVEIRNSANSKIADLPVVALTGNVNDDQIASYMKLGMSGFLAKPIDPEKLNELVEQAALGELKIGGVDNTNSEDSNIVPVAEPELPANNDPTFVTEGENESVTEQPVLNEPLMTEPPKDLSKKTTMSVSRTTSVKRTPPPLTSSDNERSPLEQSLMAEKEDNAFEKEIINVEIDETPLHGVELEPEVNVTNTDTSDSFDEDMLNNLKGHLDIAAIKAMLDEVFEKSDEIAISLKAANENKDAIELHARAHELKGMTGNFGLKEISTIAAMIEEKAKAEDFTDVGEQVEKMPTALTNAKAAVENWLNN